MNSAVATIIFGLAASLCWGSGDFSGGLAARRTNTTGAVIAAYTIGLILMVILALIWQEQLPSLLDAGWSCLAGLVGAVGLVAFYSALSTGRMGIAAPITAILTASLPVIFSAFTAGLPSLMQFGGFILALLAIGLISHQGRTKELSKGLWLAVLAGCCFGCYFIFISRVSHTETFWPLALARFISILFLLPIGLIRQQKILPGIAVAPLLLLAGILNSLGNVFFVLAAHVGRLDVAAVLSSLYPVATVILAIIVLRERMTRIQGIGVIIALVAIPLISA